MFVPNLLDLPTYKIGSQGLGTARELCRDAEGNSGHFPTVDSDALLAGQIRRPLVLLGPRGKMRIAI